MPLLPPHLETDREISEDPLSEKKKPKSAYGRQGPSKYGKGGRRAYTAKGKKKK